MLGLAWALLGVLLVSSLAPPLAAGHARSVSYSIWEIGPKTTRVSVRVPLLELSRLGAEFLPPTSASHAGTTDGADRLVRRFSEDLVLVANGVRCTPRFAHGQRPDDTGWVRLRWTLECPTDARSLEIRSRLLLDVAPSHMHFARVRFGEGADRVRERVLTEASPAWTLRGPDEASSATGTGAPTGSRIRDYVALGIDHILTGWDHLAFVFGLLLLASRFGEVARLITGFTIAHSLTLALAVQDLIHPRTAAVEAIIAFSVALVAIEKGWILSDRNRLVPAFVLASIALLGLVSMLGWAGLPVLTSAGLLVFAACYFSLAARSRSEWLRVCLTFAFGLVHGFGFAGVLVEMTLPTDRLVPALVGFNLGVEIGQLGVVLLLWPLLVLASRIAPGRTRQLAGELSAAALCGLGVYWLALRAFAL